MIHKNNKFFIYIFSSVCSFLMSHYSFANNMEKITITAPHISTDSFLETTAKVTDPDLASWLNSVPGANINRNGPVTGIAQYRGLFGDRVSATINGHAIIGAGPNAMDSPLSYGPTFLVESMSVYQCIAPVSAGINTLGGAIEVHTLKAKTNQTNGQINLNYRSNNQAKNTEAWLNLGSKNTAVMVYADWQKADDKESGDNIEVLPTAYNKQQVGGDIRHQFTAGENGNKGKGEVGFSYHYTDTHNAGTAALPMDINYIYGNRFNIDGHYLLNDWQLTWQLGYLDAAHVMDNFSQRFNMNPAMFRRTDADADTTDFKITLAKGNWLFGFDGYSAKHNANISNPNNMMFDVINFNNTQDEKVGFFTQWQHELTHFNFVTGLRLKHIKANTDEVSHHMAGFNMMIAGLMNNFNQADRKVSDTLIDFAHSLEYSLSKTVAISLGLGIKQRAPSYQERYLWVPMEATGGLADGNTYVGDINLKAETAYQADIGFKVADNQWLFSVHSFYQKIDDYIQGIPSQNMQVNMIAAMMMNDDNPLKYANVDAKLYGADGRMAYQFNDNWQLSSVLSYVRGQRDDINDNLYRIAPLNGQVKLSYQQNNWQADVTLHAVSAQNKVSNTNQEQKSPGYGFINIAINYDFSDALVIHGGIDNVLDKAYRNHLGGYNRVQNSDVLLMDRLPEEGRSLWAELSYSF